MKKNDVLIIFPESENIFLFYSDHLIDVSSGIADFIRYDRIYPKRTEIHTSYVVLLAISIIQHAVYHYGMIFFRKMCFDVKLYESK